jgi:hypothetical protein
MRPALLIAEELDRVRMRIAALQCEETELVTALHVLERLSPDETSEEAIQFAVDTGEPLPPSATSFLWGPAATSAEHSDEVSNSGVIDLALAFFDNEPSAVEPPSPEVKRIPTGARKVRPYCQQPAACVAPSRGACRLCQADSFERYGAGGRKARGTEGPPDTAPLPAPPIADAAEPPPQLPTGAQLADELDAFIATHGLAKTKVAEHLFGTRNYIERLRKRCPYRATIEKVRTFLAAPPPAMLKSEAAAPLGDRRYAVNRRDSTAKPETPLMDREERQRVNGQRHSAEIRRGQEQKAAARLDAGQKGRTSVERAQMADIGRRRADEARQADPIEQAKLALQRKGRVVYSASVSGGRKDRFIVSGQPKELTPAELVALAEKVTGQTFRRSA